jgi:cation diffusion facilitator CzcD-associated flavoprotein CzcO
MPDVNPAPTSRERDALIIGAGFAGLYQSLYLRDRLGLKAQVLEARKGALSRGYIFRYCPGG